MGHVTRSSFAKDAVAATVILVGLSGLTYGVQTQPLQIPGYILLVGFGTVGGAFGPRAVFPVVYGVYLIALGVAGAAAVHAVQRRLPETHLSSWRLGVAGALGVVGTLSILFAVIALFGTSQMDAVLLTGASGLILLSLASWLTGLFTVSIGTADK